MEHYDYDRPPLGDDLATGMGAALAEFNSAVFTGPGRIPRRYRELIAVAVGLTTQCTGCISVHTRGALALGATTDEIAEVTYITAAVRAGGATAHGALSLSVAKRQH